MKKLKSFCILLFAFCILLAFGTVAAGAEENATCAVCNTDTVTNGICSNASCTQPYQAPEVIDGENDPLKVQYAIKNAGNLYWYAALVNGGIDGKEQNINANAVLLNDIDLNPGYTFTIDASYNLVVKQGDETVTDLSVLRTWTPIGQHSATNRYNGTFIGNDNTIRGVYINGTSDKQGLFAVLEGVSKVSHVKVENSYVRGNGYVGGIAGYKSGTVEWCTFDGTVVGSADNVGGIVGYNNAKPVSNCENNGTVVGGAQYVGGIVGYNNYNNSQTVSDCVNNGPVVGTSTLADHSNACAGGIAGYSNGSVLNCVNNGPVLTSSYYCPGGIVGYNKGSVSYCENHGSVTGGWATGGIVGYNSNKSSVSYCENHGSVTSDNQNTGGVVGYSWGGITHSHNTGTVQGEQYVGGVVGQQVTSASVSYCYNTGSVEGKWDWENNYFYGAVGGIVGEFGANGYAINACYNTGAVTATGAEKTYVGGLVGRLYNNTTVSNSYNTGKVTAKNTKSYVGGVAGSTSDDNSSGSVSNCYYLTDTASRDEGTVEGQTFAKDETVFKSGELTWLLNGGNDYRGAKQATNSVWFQALGENGDVAPVLSAVYDPADSTKITNSIYRYIVGGTCTSPAEYRYTNVETAHNCAHDEDNAYTSDNFTKTDDGAVCSICGEEAVASVVYSTVTEYYTVFANALARANSIENAKLTLFADVEANFEISGNVILELGASRITGTVTVAEGAALQIDDVALTNTLNVQNNGTLRRSATYDPSNATDMGYLNIVNMAENEVKTVVNQQVITGELSVTLDRTELTYVGNETKPTVIVKVGDTVLTENTHYTLTWSDNVTNVGDKSVSVVFKDCVQTEEETVAQRELSWRIVKGTVKAENVKAAHEYGSDRTTAKVSEFEITLDGADEGFIVEGTWSDVTYNEEEQKYYVTFREENVNDLTVELTDESFFTTAVDVKDLTVKTPQWLIADDSLTLTATGTNPNNGEDAISELMLTYWYKIGDGAWQAISGNGNALTLTATDLNGATTVLLKVTTGELGGKYNATESEAVTLTVKSTSDVLVNLENAIKDLNTSTTEDLKELAEKITALDTAMKNAEDAIAKAATKDEVTQIEAALKEADKTMQDALNALSAKNAELSAAIADLETDLNTTIEGLTDRIQALENQITELESKDSGLQVFTIIVCVISGIALCGCGAFVTWFFLDKKKKV